MAVEPPALALHEVSKRFVLNRQRAGSLKEAVVRRRRRDLSSDFWALRDVSFEVAKGTSFGVIGHNGSGKSTLLRMMAGIHRPTSGTVATNGRVSALLELGSGFHPELTGRENVFLNGAILGIPRRQMEDVLDSVVQFADIGEFIDQPVKVYSSGMYVRLGYAVAVHVDPEIVLVDEVLAVGDEDFQRKCLDHMYSLRRQGVTIVLVSHALPFVQMLCDRAIWLDHGRVRASGTTEEVLRTYAESVTVAEVERQDGAEHAAESGDDVHGGSGEIVLHLVTWADRSITPVPYLVKGEPYIARIWYDARAEVDDPVLTIDVAHERGTVVMSYTSRRSGVELGRIRPGQGYIDVDLGELALNPGHYYLSTVFTDTSGLHVFDRVDRTAAFHVRDDSTVEHRGLLELPARFSRPVPHDLGLVRRSPGSDEVTDAVGAVAEATGATESG